MGRFSRVLVGFLVLIGIAGIFGWTKDVIDGPQYEIRADSYDVDEDGLVNFPPLWLIERDGLFSKKQYPLRYFREGGDLQSRRRGVWQYRIDDKWEEIPMDAEIDIDRMGEQIRAFHGSDDREREW